MPQNVFFVLGVKNDQGAGPNLGMSEFNDEVKVEVAFESAGEVKVKPEAEVKDLGAITFTVKGLGEYMGISANVGESTTEVVVISAIEVGTSKSVVLFEATM